YLVKSGNIYTFPATKRILHGCVRMAVERFVADLNIPFIPEPFSLEDITLAYEMFLTSSTSDVLPIVKVDGKQKNHGTQVEITPKMHKASEKAANITQKLPQ